MNLGDWVKVETAYYTYRGYITDEDETHYTVRRVFRIHPDGTTTKEDYTQRFYKSNTTKLEVELHEDDVKEMIDLAIDTRDVEWLQQLSR